MVAICIHKSENKYHRNHRFTIGEKYEYFIQEGTWWVKNESDRMIGFQWWQFQGNFMDLGVWREKKLKQLDIF